MDSSAGQVPVEPARWYRVVGADPEGPVGLDTIRGQVLAGVVTADTLVWADGMPDWMPARKVPALIPPQPWRSQLGWPPLAGDAIDASTDDAIEHATPHDTRHDTQQEATQRATEVEP